MNTFKMKHCKGEILITTACTIGVLMFSVCSSCLAQYAFSRWDSIPVIIASDTIEYPWAGGLNNPQFSDIDLNGDGIMDLFVFDRSGNKVITFLNSGTPNVVDYKYAPEYQTKFPDLHGWALLADYNGDGKKDIYTSAYNGVKVYRNDYNIVDGLKFTLVNSLLEADSSLLYISEWDFPAITDADGDGDIDILTFDFGGATMYYYRNLSVENYGNADSLRYTLNNKCWGNFMESWGDCSVTLGISCKWGKTSEITKELHAGSTTLALDLDCDNDKEVIIGDITCANTYMLTNGGDSISASMISVDTQYPIAYPIDIQYFPIAFYVDVNNDGARDLLAAPNALNISENFTSSWYYKNTNTDCAPSFSFQTNAFLQDEMIEVGEGANPGFFDYNADSLPDLVIGNHGYFSNTGTYLSELSLYKNTGTTNAPVFKLITRDYANISSYGFLGVYPAFGDLDGDGDEDMMLGESGGNLHYFNNTAGSGNPANFVLTQPYYKGIDIGQCSAPQLVDVNRDGLLDLLIGERNGNLNYYENTGSVIWADFTLVSNTFGGVNVKKPGYITGYSSPFLTVLDSSGEYILLVGSESGYIYRYGDIDSNLNGNFTLADSMFLDIDAGERANISGGDINHDGTFDLVIGNYRGGAVVYRNDGDSIPPPTLPPPPPPFSITILPNPAYENLYVSILGTSEGDVAEIELYNMRGQKIYSTIFDKNHKSIAISVKNYVCGIYICRVKVSRGQELPDSSVIRKFAVVR